MILRLPLGSARRFAALLLFLGVMLGGTVDAIACEPATDATVSMMSIGVSESQTGDDRLPKGDHDGVCIHGHCHHGVSHIQPAAALTHVPAYPADHPLPREHGLASIIPDTLKRPPRA